MSPTSTPRGGTLVVQPLPGIGDTIWYLPHLRAIADAAPDKTITLLTKERSQARELLSASDHIREVIYLAPDGGRHSGLLGGWRLGEDLRPHEFGEVWILHGSSRYALAACRAGIPKRMGFGIGWQDALLTSPHGLSRRDRALSSIGKANRLLRLHDLPVSENGTNLELPEPARQAAEIMLASLPTPAIALAIGSSEAFKQWGIENFVGLIRALRKEKDYSIVLVGGTAETEAAKRLAALFDNPSWLAARIDEPILEAAAVMSGCQACIGNDTGMLQIAAAVGTPSLGLFGGSKPLHQDPRIAALSPNGKMRYCKDRMAEISVEMVVDSFLRLDTGQ
jgi:heptosyltransferase II